VGDGRQRWAFYKLGRTMTHAMKRHVRRKILSVIDDLIRSSEGEERFLLCDQRNRIAIFLHESVRIIL
jgi:hypothetical protein